MRILSVVAVLVSLCFQAAIAGDFEIGMERYFAKDYAGAFAPLRSAAAQGDANAQAVLGVMYSGGQGVPKDDAQAAMWTTKAAQQGVPAAQARLGNMYRQGIGVAQDLALAFQWSEKAAFQGNALGQYSVAYAYQYGQGTAQSDQLAVEWYGKAALQGLAQAQLNLGICYENGKGVTKDLQVAMGWYEKAAEQGLVDAQRILGILYVTGGGGPANEPIGLALLRKAAAQGDVFARSIIEPYAKLVEGKAMDSFKLCERTSVVELDDGISSADTIASAVLNRCHTELEAWIRAHFSEASGQGLQNLREGVEVGARNDIARIVLELRSAKRRAPNSPPRSTTKPKQPEA